MIKFFCDSSDAFLVVLAYGLLGFSEDEEILHVSLESVF